MTVKKNFDSDFCGSLPLHHINSIQDYGYLIVLDKSDLKIIQASENVSVLLNNNIDQIVGSSLHSYLEEGELNKIIQIAEQGLQNRIPLSLQFNQRSGRHRFEALQHTMPDYVLIELEQTEKSTTRSFTNVFQSVKLVSSAIERAETVQEVCEIAIREIRKIAEFDAVLMYRFDSDWNGTVLAEEKDGRLEPYLGQTFPASDIPKQARQLYLKNPYRLIADREYKAVRLYPVVNPVTDAFTDLSDCNLRGVAAVHLEYMKNMGIKASMSIRVIHNQSLWGLISCHHIDKKYINYEVCSIFEWLSDVISTKISLILNKEEYQAKQSLHLKRNILSERILAENDICAGLLNEDKNTILDLFKASGAVIQLNGKLELKGKLPPKDDLDNILLWLEGKSLNKIFSTQHLSSLYDDATTFISEGSGLLAIPIHGNKAEMVVCFRPELIQDIHWGGDPNQAINFEKDGKTYHPRNSFKLWKQRVQQNSLPWTEQEIEVAESLRSFLFEFRAKQLEN